MTYRCDYCNIADAEISRVNCGACKKTYKGHFCSLCAEDVRQQKWCYVSGKGADFVPGQSNRYRPPAGWFDSFTDSENELAVALISG